MSSTNRTDKCGNDITIDIDDIIHDKVATKTSSDIDYNNPSKIILLYVIIILEIVLPYFLVKNMSRRKSLIFFNLTITGFNY